jgi:hypothetical protein
MHFEEEPPLPLKEGLTKVQGVPPSFPYHDNTARLNITSSCTYIVQV